MSLINQVLTDLNHRRSGFYLSGNGVFVGTVPASYTHRSKRIQPFFIGVGLFVLVIAILLWFASKYNPEIMNYIYDNFPNASRVKNDSYSVTLKLSPNFSPENNQIALASVNEIAPPLVKEVVTSSKPVPLSATSSFSNHLRGVFTKEVSSLSLGDNKQLSLLLSANVGATKNGSESQKKEKYAIDQTGYTPVMVLDSSMFVKSQTATETPPFADDEQYNKSLKSNYKHLESSDNLPINKPIRVVTNEQRAEQIYQQALVLNADGNLYQASSKLKEALLLNAAHLKARYTLVALLINANQSDEALKELMFGMDMQPDHAPFAKLYGRLMMLRGQFDDAIITMQSARSNAQQDPEYYAQLAAIYQQQKKHTEAIAYFQQALRWQPTVGVWWMGLGISLEQQQQKSDAVIAYRKADATGTLSASVSTYVQDRIKSLDKW